MPTIGIMHSGHEGIYDKQIRAFKNGLALAGYDKENTNYTIADNDPSWAGDDKSQLDVIAKNLVAQNVDLLVAAGGTDSALAAKKATLNANPGNPINVVFTTVTDPVGNLLVASLIKPGKNVTGICASTSELDEKTGFAEPAHVGPGRLKHQRPSKRRPYERGRPI